MKFPQPQTSGDKDVHRLFDFVDTATGLLIIKKESVRIM